MTWWSYALLSALFAALTAILAKVGVEGVPSTLATALRTVVILAFAWGIALARGEHHALPSLSRKTLLFLGLSGVATGLSWLAYFRALQLGPASRVAPLDKLSLALTVGLSVLLLKEPMNWRLGLGVVLMVTGALLTLK
jgi:bacterial/archaeal transporter family protein